MKIKYIDGTIKDSAEMSDIQAVLAEKSNELIQEFLKYKIPFLLRWYNPSDNSFGGSCNFNYNPEHFFRVIDSINHFLKVDLKSSLQISDIDNRDENYQ